MPDVCAVAVIDLGEPAGVIALGRCRHRVIYSRQDHWSVDPWNFCIVMYFDRETVALLRATLDRAWASLPPSEQAATSRSVVAERILKAAARGERNADRLHARALSDDRPQMEAAS
jgi:hypothetical protein